MLGAIMTGVLLVATIVVTFHNTRELNADTGWVSHTHEVIGGLESVLALAADAETGQRGYVISGEAKYLAPYTDATQKINRRVDELQRLTADNPAQQARFPELRRRIASKLRELDETIALRRDKGYEAARAEIVTDRGKNEMDALRAIVGEMSEGERVLLHERLEQSARTYHVALFSGLFTGLAASGALAAFFVLLGRHLRERAASAGVIAEQSERLRVTLASIGDAVLTTDAQGRVVYLNEVAERLTGWSSEEAAGKSLETVFRIVNESTRQTVENPAQRALRDGTIVGLANHTILIAKNGVERPIDDSAAPIRSQSGQITGCVLVFRDVTDRKRAEDALRLSEARKSEMFESALDCIISIDHRGSILEFNAAAERTLGHRRQDVMGKELASVLIPHAQRENHRRGLARVLETGEGPILNQRLELTALRADGGEFPVELTVTRVDTGGSPLFTAYMRDISDRKKAQAEREQLLVSERTARAEAERAGQLKDEFLATLSHELRTPLNAVMGWAHILRKSPPTPELVEQGLAVIDRNARLQAQLIADLLDMSRIISGKMRLDVQRVELPVVIEAAIDSVRPAAEAKDVRLTSVIDPVQDPVHGDPARLQQIVWNLVSNAVKFTSRGGQVQVVLARVNSHVELSVSDTGKGIRGEFLPHVFERFRQADSSPAREHGGLGLGLSIVKQLVELHGGRVMAASDGEGKGAVFTVHLPLAAVHATPAPAIKLHPKVAAAEPANLASPDLSGVRVLVVDDERDARDLVKHVLEERHAEAILAASPIEALAIIEQQAPDVIISDIGMPEQDGYEFIRAVRQRGLRTPAVALTAFARSEDRTRALSAGYQMHVTKPVEPAELLATVAALVRMRA